MTRGSRAGRAGGGPALIVQQSFPRPRPTTNPYLVMLGRSIARQPGVGVRLFSWRSALTASYDVFHVHWPEILVSGHSPLKKLARQALTLLLVARLAVLGVPIVRTVHNLELPDGISRRERWLLRIIDRRTALVVVLNDETPRNPDVPTELIPHGHYRDWFESFERPARERGRVSFVGLVRRYKGVEDLVRSFRGVASDATLHVAGRPSTPEIARELEGLAKADDRVTLDLRFLDDHDLVDAVDRASLVVLPYRHMHNSGTALTALSLDRPVLVPDNEVTSRLGDEVGAGWVHRFDGELTAADIEQALASAETLAPDARPDLSAREWQTQGERHVAAYRRAIQTTRRSRR